jgi:hypothetical protein
VLAEKPGIVYCKPCTEFSNKSFVPERSKKDPALCTAHPDQSTCSAGQCWGGSGAQCVLQQVLGIGPPRFPYLSLFLLLPPPPLPLKDREHSPFPINLVFPPFRSGVTVEKLKLNWPRTRDGVNKRC